MSSLLRRRSALRLGLAVRVDAPMRGHVGHAVSCWVGMYSGGVGIWALPLSLRFMGLAFPIISGKRFERD